MKGSDVVIVGGGAVGCATAYFLAKEGVKATVLESNRVAYGASGYAMGLLSPLSGVGIPGPLEELSQEGFRMHRQLAGELKEATGIDYHAHPYDSLYLAFGDHRDGDLEAVDGYSGQVEGVSCQWLDGPQVRALESRVSDRVTKALMVRGSWILEAQEYTQALAKAAEGLGAFVRHGEVQGLRKSGANIEIRTEAGFIEAAKVVLAMGPWTGTAREWLGLPIPVHPLKGQILRLAFHGPPLHYTLHCGGNYAGSKPDGLVWIGTTEETVGFDDRPTEEARAQIMREVALFLPAITRAYLVKQTACLRPVSADGLPIIGQVPGWDGVYCATGAGRKGILLSPSMARAVTQLITRGQSEVSVDLFSPARFVHTPSG